MIDQKKPKGNSTLNRTFLIRISRDLSLSLFFFFQSPFSSFQLAARLSTSKEQVYFLVGPWEETHRDHLSLSVLVSCWPSPGTSCSMRRGGQCVLYHRYSFITSTQWLVSPLYLYTLLYSLALLVYPLSTLSPLSNMPTAGSGLLQNFCAGAVINARTHHALPTYLPDSTI